MKKFLAVLLLILSIGGIGTGVYFYVAPNKTQKEPNTKKENTYEVQFKDDEKVLKKESVKPGTTVGKPENPSKEGYIFAGWYNAESMTEFDFNSYINSDTIIIAKWSPKEFKIVFDYKGGSELVKNKSVLFGTEYGNLPKPTKNGYTFDGWYTEEPGGKNITATDFYKNDGDQILYAHWSPVKYTITYNYNGGSANNPTVYDSTTNTFKLNNPTRKGYTFTGWSGSGLKTLTKDVSINKGTSGNLTFTANWEGASYTITFNTSGGNVSPTNKKVTYRNAYGELPLPTKTGYAFDGWYTSASGGTKITANTTFNEATNQTLYARWTAVKYTITYNYNGGSGQNPAGYNSTTNTFKLNYPTKTGYTFTGWTGSGLKKLTKDVSITKGTSGNLSFTANWEISKYTITFDSNGGSASSSSKQVNYNSKYGTLPTVSKTAYSFAGWYTSKTAGTKVDSNTLLTNASNHTLYAHWTPIKYTITYNYNGGSASNPTSYTIETATFSLKNPTRTGYSFTGWSLNGAKSLIKNVAISKGTYGNLSYVANWEALKYTVSFNGNGGTPGQSSKTVTYNDVYRTLPSATRAGYTFTGWYTSASGGTKIDEKTTVSVASNHTLYAHWTQEKSTLNLNGVIDGKSKSSLSNFATADVYVNGKLVGSSVQDFESKYDYGTTYEIKNIKAKDGYTCSGVASGSKLLSGKVTGETLVSINCTTKKITVTFMRNTSTTDQTSSTQTFTYGVAGQTFSDKKWTRTGYYLAGWSTSRDGSVVYTTLSGVASSWINKYSPSITLYAVWSQSTSYLDLNGSIDGTAKSSLSDFATADIYVDGKLVASGVQDYYVKHGYGSSYEIKNIKPKTGYACSGVASGSAALSGTIKGPNTTTVTISCKTTITYVATFNKNAASSVGSTSASCSPKSGQTTCTVTAPKITAKTNTIALGWSTDASATQASYAASSNITLSKNQTFYAITRSTDTYKITFWPESAHFNNYPQGTGMTYSAYRYNGESQASIVAPDIVLQNPSIQTLKGWSTKKYDPNPPIKPKGIVKFNDGAVMYASISGDVTVTFSKNKADSLSLTSVKCTNNGSGCVVPPTSLPRIYSKGNQINGFSISANGPIYRVTKQVNTGNTTFYAIIANEYRSTLPVSKVEYINGVAFEVENSSSLKSTVINTLIANAKDLYSRMPFLFDSRTKVNLVSTNTYGKTFGYDSVGMTYGYTEYPNIDVSVSYNYDEFDSGCIIHELGHAWDDWYEVMTGKSISSQSDVIAMYRKYKNYSSNNRPLRDYAYTNEGEFVAEMAVYYYYYKYKTSVRNPSGGKAINAFGTEVVALFEKYANISRNGYK